MKPQELEAKSKREEQSQPSHIIDLENYFEDEEDRE